jgi:hypothetical protein
VIAVGSGIEHTTCPRRSWNLNHAGEIISPYNAIAKFHIFPFP